MPSNNHSVRAEMMTKFVKSGKASGAWTAVFILVFALLVFRTVLVPGNTLFTTDDNIGALALIKNALPDGFFRGWNDNVMAGMPRFLALNSTNLFLWIFPVEFFCDWIHAIDLGLASLFLCLFLRKRGVGWCAALCGALVAFWMGSNFTLTYAGHIGKFGVLLWASAALYLFEKALESRHFAWSVLCGGAFAVMFLEQADVALFFAMAIGPYCVIRVLHVLGKDWKRIVLLLAPLPVLVLLIAVPPLKQLLGNGVPSSSIETAEDARQKWEFATQWSWPPEECIDFVAPGFMGWRSGERNGPYVGRMGRQAGWEKTHQGFRNFKLENQYLGWISFLLAAAACIHAFLVRREKRGVAVDVLFWLVVCGLTLFLSFGKHFFLYRLFYHLPVVSSIRNPNKFLQVFQFGLGILAAYGLNAVAGISSADESVQSRRIWQRFIHVALVIAGLFAIWALVAAFGLNSAVRRFSSEGWGNMALVIARNRVWALWHAVGFCLIGVGLIALVMNAGRRNRPGYRLAGCMGIVLMIGIDALALSRNYVKPFVMEQVAANPVIDRIKADIGCNRTAFVMTGTAADQVYNYWITYLFPYHGIKCVNVSQMPRMPKDYSTFFGALNSMPFRLWQQFGVKYIIAPAEVWMQIQNNEQLKGVAELAYAFNVEQLPNGAMKVTPGSQQQPGRHCMLQLKVPSGRAAMITKWETVDDSKALALLTSDKFGPMLTALVARSNHDVVPECTGQQGVDMSINCEADEPGRVSLRAFVNNPCILRFAENYDPAWQVTVDDIPAENLRVDYLFQGVYLGLGVHNVCFRYAPSKLPFVCQILGYLVCIGAGAWLVLVRGHPKGFTDHEIHETHEKGEIFNRR